LDLKRGDVTKVHIIDIIVPSFQPKERIGNSDQVKKHPFFKGLDWQKLAKKQVKPPFMPKLLNEKDLRYISSVTT